MKKTKDRITSMLNAITSSDSGGSESDGKPTKNRLDRNIRVRPAR